MIIEQTLERGRPVVHHWFRDEHGQKTYRKYSDMLPYFYVPSEDKGVPDAAIVQEQEGYQSIYGDNVRKIIVKTPQDAGRLKANYNKTFECDIRFHYRYLIDHELEFGSKPKCLYLDAEIDFTPGKFPDPYRTEEQIVCITTYNDITQSFTTFFLEGKETRQMRAWHNRVTGREEKWLLAGFETERRLLAMFAKHVAFTDCDVITGWNTDSFDLPYIVNRMRKVGVDAGRLSPLGVAYARPASFDRRTMRIREEPPIIKGRILFDLLKFYRKMNSSELEANDLDTVGERELEVSKVKYTGKLSSLYRQNPEKLIEYNVGDVELCVEIDRKVRIIDTFWELSRLVRCRMEQTESESQMIDMYQLWYNKQNGGRVLPTKTASVAQTFEGATVIEPQTGVYDNVFVLDLEKIYPSIILSCNISPETIVLDKQKQGDFVVLPNGIRFSKQEAFSPGVLKRLFEVEAHFKQQMRKYKIGTSEYERERKRAQFTKDIRNSYYGVLAYEGSRCYVPEAGACITLMGREILEWCVQKAKEKGYQIVSGDTDSIMVLDKSQNAEESVREAHSLKDFINASFDEFAARYNIAKHYFRIDYKQTYAPLLIAKKKHYAGYVRHIKDRVEKDFLEVRGFEPRRSDNNDFTKSFMLQMFEMILQRKPVVEINRFVLDSLRRVRELPPENIALRVAFRKDISDYKIDNCYTLGAEFSRQRLGIPIGRGSKLFFVFCKSFPAVLQGKGAVRIRGVCFEAAEQLAKVPEAQIDYDYMMKRLVLYKARNVYESLGWSLSGLGFLFKPRQRVFDISQKTLEGY